MLLGVSLDARGEGVILTVNGLRMDVKYEGAGDAYGSGLWRIDTPAASDEGVLHRLQVLREARQLHLYREQSAANIQVAGFCPLPVGVFMAVGETSGAGATNTTVRIVRVTDEIWTLLCGVVNKDTADKAAERFAELSRELWKLNEATFDGKAQDVESLDSETYRIADVYESASYEFDSLCRTHCYGSDALAKAFLKAMDLGVFGDAEKEKLQLTNVILANPAAREEIERLRSMKPIDTALYENLSHVKDAPTANKVVPRLESLTKQMNVLRPLHRYGVENFPTEYRAEAKAVFGELEPILWNIRDEIVRIAALDGYANEPFDHFSDAMDAVFELLSCTHGESFDEVFDTSFRIDVDDALHGGMTMNP